MVVENTFAGLCGPGRWVVDINTRKLYCWPRGEQPTGVVVPRLTELLRIEGVTRYDELHDEPVRFIEVLGLSFKHGQRYEHWGQTGLGLQHDWERFDSATALVRMKAAEACVVARCQFSDAGGSGLRLDLHAQRNSIIGNSFSKLGGCGVLLAGYGPGRKDCNKENHYCPAY